MSCLPIRAPVVGQPLGRFSSGPSAFSRSSSSVALPLKLNFSSKYRRSAGPTEESSSTSSVAEAWAPSYAAMKVPEGQ